MTDPLGLQPIREGKCLITFEIRRDDDVEMIDEMVERLKFVGLMPRTTQRRTFGLADLDEPYLSGEHVPPNGVRVVHIDIDIHKPADREVAEQ